ncbi:DUF1593 domain-containing protein [Streptomyces heilongjiangensis]|uniref:Nucleoside hydrolase-like domain-containing protein n=1 Tax=Streptomyces heilongjiangensis TaxID=945052 RepID=A0ABW1BJZ1_9ACTN
MRITRGKARRTGRCRTAVVALSLLALAGATAGTGTPATAASQGTAPATVRHGTPMTSGSMAGTTARPRTVVTTDMEQDDLASLVRYLLYTNDLDTEGIVYTSSMWHWAGDDSHSPMRWTGTRTIQDIVLKAYAEVYPNLRKHDPRYPTPAALLSKVKTGNIAYEGEMSHDTEGSDLIRKLLLDHDPRPVHLQVWGGPNTVARALKSIQDRYEGSPWWVEIHERVSKKAVILASGLQDPTYKNYIAPNWPDLRTEELSAGYATWGYNCDWSGQGNTRGLPGDEKYFRGAWTKQNIQTGPLGSLYRSWLDGQAMPGDPADIFGDPQAAKDGWCKPLSPYDFLSEGDNVAYLPLLDTGIQAPGNPNLGGWGGRAARTSASSDLWTMVPTETDETGAELRDYTTNRWEAAVQNDFAARMRWTLAPGYRQANHAPFVGVASGGRVRAVPGQVLNLRAVSADPDRDTVRTHWWQYKEEGTYPGRIALGGADSATATVTVPADARPGQTISVILQGTDDGDVSLTRYARIVIQVVGSAHTG